MAAHESRKFKSTTRTASVLLTTAEQHFDRARWRPALAAFAGVARAVPDHLRARLRIGDILLNLGERRRARDVYRALVDVAAVGGQPLLAIAAVKLVHLLDDDNDDTTAADDGLDTVTARFAVDSERLDALFAGPQTVVVGDAAADAIDDDDTLFDVAVAIATQPATTSAPILPVVPFFSLLDEDAFATVVAGAQLRRFSDEEFVIRQGDRSESLFMIADGEVLIRKEDGNDDDDDEAVTLAHLRRGAVFGELSLISDEPRQASVIAHGEVDIIELRCADLVVAAASTPGVSEALRRFTRERFLRNLTATHPFFAPLSKPERHRVMEVTHVATFTSGEVLIEEGQRGPGLFVLLGGQAAVKKKLQKADDVEHIHLATLRGGDLCGEMSMLNDAPTTATVTCVEPLEALFLSRDSFREVTSEHPSLLRYLASVTDERLRHNRALLSGRGLIEDDEHVMI